MLKYIVYDLVELWNSRSEKIFKVEIGYTTSQESGVFILNLNDLYYNYDKYKIDNRHKRPLVDYLVKSAKVQNNILKLEIY